MKIKEKKQKRKGVKKNENQRNERKKYPPLALELISTCVFNFVFILWIKSCIAWFLVSTSWRASSYSGTEPVGGTILSEEKKKTIKKWNRKREIEKR